jgi:hypothetical protein
MPASLPVNMWNKVARHLNKRNVASLRGASTETKAGTQTFYDNLHRTHAVGKAYDTVTTSLVWYLMKALRLAPDGLWIPKNGYRSENPSGNLVAYMVPVGRYQMFVTHLLQPPRAGIVWVRAQGRPVNVGDWEPHHGWEHPDFRTLGPGGVTVGRLVKAAIRRAANPNVN